MGSSSKRQQTAAKRNREQAVREKRARKQEKKDAKAAVRAAYAEGGLTPQYDEDGNLIAPFEMPAPADEETATEPAG